MNLTTINNLPPAAAHSLRRRTAPLLILALGVVFWPRLQWIAQLWATDSLYSASLLVPVICVVIASLKWHSIRERNPSAIGLVLVATAVSITIALDLTQVAIYSATPLLLIIAISGVILAGWGYQALRTLAFPILFLLFLVPVPPAMLARFDYPLQEMCARVTSVLAGLGGIETHRVGALLLFADPQVSVNVAPSCNGLRSVLAIAITAVLYVYLIRGAWYKKLAILVAAVPLAYMANFVRLLGVVLFVNWSGERFIQFEPICDHVLGFLLFSLAVLFLFLWARLLQCNQLREIG
jgi:exosortase J